MTRLEIGYPVAYEKVREVLGGGLRNSWDTIVAAMTDAQKTEANFLTKLRELAQTFLPNNSFRLMDDYLRSAVKPYHMTCYKASSRLSLINNLSRFLPGSGANKLYPDNEAFKLILVLNLRG